MSLRNWFNAFNACLLVGAVVLLPNNAQAVPSYARQTGMPCSGCHTTPPELTPFGRSFKINGYTLTGLEADRSQRRGHRCGPEAQ